MLFKCFLLPHLSTTPHSLCWNPHERMFHESHVDSVRWLLQSNLHRFPRSFDKWGAVCLPERKTIQHTLTHLLCEHKGWRAARSVWTKEAHSLHRPRVRREFVQQSGNTVTKGTFAWPRSNKQETPTWWPVGSVWLWADQKSSVNGSAIIKSAGDECVNLSLSESDGDRGDERLSVFWMLRQVERNRSELIVTPRFLTNSLCWRGSDGKTSQATCLLPNVCQNPWKTSVTNVQNTALWLVCSADCFLHLQRGWRVCCHRCQLGVHGWKGPLCIKAYINIKEH